MAMQNGTSTDGVLQERAKEVLKSEEYERLKIAVKNFSKTRSVEGLCSSLIRIVNSPSKVSILAEVRRYLPKNQRNKFTRYCNELLKTEALRGRRDFEKKRKLESKVERIRVLELENRAPNFLASPAKRSKKDGENPLNSKRGKEDSQESKKSVPDCAKEVTSSKGQGRRFGSARKCPSDSSAYKIVILERDSLNEGFGFRIRGGNSREPSIVVAEVAKGSPADRQGLKKGDQVFRVNEKPCGKGGANIGQLIRMIKAAKVLHMRIASPEPLRKDNCKVEAKGKERTRAEEKRMYTVVVSPGENGWLGCCIRGGADYACDVHIISVDADSPAERAGVKPRDTIVTINGTSTKDLTHVQVVRLVVTSGPCVRFCLKPRDKQTRRSSRRQSADVRPTPLRTEHRRAHDVTPPRSPSFREIHLPGYPHSRRREATNSPSQLPLDVLTLDCLPPPPYTPEVPSRHRVLARGDRGQGTPCRQPQDVTYVMQPQITQSIQEPQDNNFGQDAQDNCSSLGPQDVHVCQEPHSTNFDQEQQEVLSHELQGVPYQQELQGSRNQDAVMEIFDNGQEPSNSISDSKGNFEGRMEGVFQDGVILQQDNAPQTSIMQKEKVMLLEEDICTDSSLFSSGVQSPEHSNGRESFLTQIQQFNKTKLKPLADYQQNNPSEELCDTPSESCYTSTEIQTTADDDRLSAVTSQSPPSVDGRESFLSQIRKFNKAKLRKLSQNSKINIPDDQLQSMSDKTSWTPEELKSTAEGKHGAQESLDAGSLFTALTQVIQNRARVMRDTLSSADEFDSDSSFDDSDDEWEL